ncbi:MAG: OmpW family outer membrane protein [Gammaproteobacteria bacterium]
MTTLNVRTRIALLSAAALFYYAPTLADDNPNSARIGVYYVSYHVKADDLSGPFVPAGANIDANNLETAYLAYIRTIIPHWDVELAVGYPPLQKTVGKGPATLGSVPYDGQVIATARWIAPTLLLEYAFFDEGSKWRPYIGAGVNYTTFYDRNSTAAGDAASGGPTKISLTPSVGWAATAGLNYHIANNWHAYASYSFSKVTSDLTANTAGVIRTSHISFAPQALVVSVGYSF